MCSSVIGILWILEDGLDPLGWAYWSRLAGDLEKKDQMTLVVGVPGLQVGTRERDGGSQVGNSREGVGTVLGLVFFSRLALNAMTPSSGVSVIGTRQCRVDGLELLSKFSLT